MSARCPISYKILGEHDQRYSKAGLRTLHPRLENLQVLPFSPQSLLQEAARRASRMSIQGVQSKLSAVLETSKRRIQIVDTGGRLILKPPSPSYPNIPENEDLTLKMATAFGLEAPDHGLLWAQDQSLVFWIRRFDRFGQKGRRHVEDFAQLAGERRDTKYAFSVERLIGLIERFCTVPQVEKARFFERFLFNWVVGNDDMHLKNYSIWHDGTLFRMAPCYDLLSTTLVLNSTTESALPLDGRDKYFSRSLLLDYLAAQRCGLTTRVIEKVLGNLVRSSHRWHQLMQESFLPPTTQEKYWALIQSRLQRLELV